MYIIPPCVIVCLVFVNFSMGVITVDAHVFSDDLKSVKDKIKNGTGKVDDVKGLIGDLQVTLSLEENKQLIKDQINNVKSELKFAKYFTDAVHAHANYSNTLVDIFGQDGQLAWLDELRGLNSEFGNDTNLSQTFDHWAAEAKSRREGLKQNLKDLEPRTSESSVFDEVKYVKSLVGLLSLSTDDTTDLLKSIVGQDQPVVNKFQDLYSKMVGDKNSSITRMNEWLDMKVGERALAQQQPEETQSEQQVGGGIEQQGVEQTTGQDDYKNGDPFDM